MERTILHCDMNNFYASVECLHRPELRGLPVAVCGQTEERHGIVLAKNYEAKAYGVITGEAVWQAQRKCPSLVLINPHYDEYLRFSTLARDIYSRFTDIIEPLGLDECWLDVTGSRLLFGTGDEIAWKIKESIKSELHITASVGVSFNKVFAKLGSDMKKPDAVTVIPYDRFRDIIWHLPAGDMLGVGRASARKLQSMGINTIGQLATYPRNMLAKIFGKCGDDMWRFANGLDNSKVVPRNLYELDKSAGHGITTLQDLINAEEVWPIMLELSQNIGHRLLISGKKATGVAISIRDNTLQTKQWQCKLSHPSRSPYYIAKEAYNLFKNRYTWEHPIRSLTVRAINLVSQEDSYQLDLFINPDDIDIQESIDETVDALRTRYGSRIVRNATCLNSPKMPATDVLSRRITQK